MKAEVKGAGRQRAGRVAHWAAVLALMSVQAQAFPRETLQAHDRQAAMQELLGRLGDASASCQPAVGAASEKASGRIVRVQCGGQELSVKYHAQSVADVARTLDLIRQQLPDDLLAMIRQPVAEFSFDETGRGKGYYRVYSLEPGELSLHDWARGIGQRIQAAISHDEPDPALEKVYEVYKRIGRFLGAAHRAGLTNAGETFEQLQSESAIQGLDGSSIAVTSEAGVLVDLDALVTDGKMGSPARAMRAQREVLTSEVPSLTSLSLSDSAVTLAAMVFSIGYGMPLSYCAALEQKPEDEVVGGRCFALFAKSCSQGQDCPNVQEGGSR